MSSREIVLQTCNTISSPDFKAKIAQALPEGVSVDRFTRVTLTAIQQNPNILNGDRQTLYNAVIRCAQDGLQPDGKEAALVSYGDKVQYMPMIGGLRKIAAKYGITIAANAVHENDDFTYELGFEPTVTHRPPPLGQPRGEAIGAYAVATDREGRKYLEVMSKDEIEKVRSASRSGKSGPWAQWWGEMARKTVARRIWKQLPFYDMDDRDTSVLAAVDDDFEFSPPTPPAEPAPRTATSRPSGLQAALDQVEDADDEPTQDPNGDPGF